MQRANIAIEVKNLTRVYKDSNAKPVVANNDLSFQVLRGEIFGLFGANGAGKTTLVMQMLGLLRPTSGSLLVEGIDVVKEPERVKAQIGLLPQTGLAMRLIEVRRALHYTGRLRGQSEQDARRQTDELVETLGLGPFANRHVRKLSGGMMRLVNFGMALMGRPSVLILDEPTNELDPHNRRLVWNVIRQRNLEGATVVLVTHNVLEAEKVIQRVAVMNSGQIVALGTPGELKARLSAQARFDLYLKENGQLSGEELARLGTLGTVEALRENHYQLFLPPEQVVSVAEFVSRDIGLGRVDDFRIARPSLEDVYLQLDRNTSDTAGDATSPAVTPEAPAALPEATEDALPPAPQEHAVRPPLRGRVGFFVALKYLWFEQMLEVRSTWPWSLMFGVLMPIAMVFGLSRIGQGLTDRSSLLFIISGSAVFAIVTESILALAQRVGVIRQQGMLLYYASLPISMAAFITAIILGRLLIIVPNLITPVIAGSLMYSVDLEISPLLLVIVPLTIVALSAVGIAIGASLDNFEVILVVTNLLTFVLLLAAPVLIPVESLPRVLQVLGYVLPPTYAADALRRTLAGQLDAMVVIDLVVLAFMAVTSMLVASRWMRWRTA